MKKSLLALVAIGASMAAYATTDFTQVWQQSVAGATTEAIYSPVTAVDAAGNLYVAGAYTEDFTLAGVELEAIGTSAYIAKYDATGAITWAVGLTGSVTVSAITTDADGNIYVAGQLADEVVFNTTSGESVAKTGMEVDGAATIEQNAAFIAKYDAQGVVKAVETFVPEIYPEPASSIDNWDALIYYFYEDGDVYFNISDIKVADGKLYIAAVYTGTTTFGDTKFDAPLGTVLGWMYADMAATSIFSVDAATLSGASVIATVADASEDLSFIETTSPCWSAKFDINNGKIFAAFVGSGSLAINGTSVNNEGTAFIFATIDGTTVDAHATAATEASVVANNSIAAVYYNGTDATVLGRVYTEEEVETEVEGETETVTVQHEDIFATTVGADLTADITPFSEKLGDVAYKRIASTALLADGDVYVNTLGYYTTAGDGYKNGDFANAYKSFIVSAGEFTAAPVQAVAVAAAGDKVAFGAPTATGAEFSLYTATTAGIADIVVDSADASAQYYNLQGIRVANPQNGIFVRVAGGKATKVVK